MPAKRRRKSTKSGPKTGAAAVLFLALIGIFLGFIAWQEGKLPEAASTALETAVALPGSDIPGSTIPDAAATLGAELGIPTQTAVVVREAGGALAVFFTDPASTPSGEALEAAMVASVDAAQRTVDVAVYNLSNENLADAFIRAQRRGVRVRVVLETDAMDRIIPAGLQAAGIPIIGDQRDGLMHNKFIVVDGREVWTGSSNFTDTGFYQDFNNMVRIQSEQMAQNYQVNFEEMFVDRRFGPAKQPNTPYPQLVIGDIPFEVYFSPDDGVAERLVDEIRAARSSIHFLAYSYTRDDFAEAMLDQAQRGVRVHGVFDLSQVQSNTGGEYENLLDAGLDVRLDGISGLMHNKVMVIDQQVVITGSYNFSANAERSNDENVIIIRDAGVASQYMQHFERVYSVSAAD